MTINWGSTVSDASPLVEGVSIDRRGRGRSGRFVEHRCPAILFAESQLDCHLGSSQYMSVFIFTGRRLNQQEVLKTNVQYNHCIKIVVGVCHVET